MYRIEMDQGDQIISEKQKLFLLDILKLVGKSRLLAIIHSLAEKFDSNENIEVIGDDTCDRKVGETVDLRDNVAGSGSQIGAMESPLTTKSEIIRILTDNQGECRLSDRLMRSDPADVAMEIKDFLQLHNISQREVVMETKIKQSHLSQHLGRGTPMAEDRRKTLYDWYEKRKTELQSSNGECRCAREPPKKRKRGGFKWPPAYRKLLEDSYNKNRNPSKVERSELAKLVESYQVQGKGSRAGLCRHTHRVSELQIYNWFANRRRQQQNKKPSTTLNSSDC